MTNPHPANETDIDIRAAANRIIEQFRHGRYVQAFQALERERTDERLVVQEALDRYIAVGARPELDRAQHVAALEGSAALERLRQAAGPPRMPEYNGRDGNAPNELAGLTEAQKYDIYASIVEMRGNQAASDALRNEQSVILGLRKETSTVRSMDDPRIPGARDQERGTGVYDDHIVVLRKEDGERHWFIADRANTEPTAQYDAHARPAPGRENTVHANVQWRRPQGERADGDAIPDLGRMEEGSFEMMRATHAARGNPNDFSLRPTPDQARAPRNAHLVHRDTNGDGWFTQNDIEGVQRLNDSFKIHAGSFYNTDSAGCQTIHPGEYDGFIQAVGANRQQTRWQYVLTSTGGGLFHDVNRDNERVREPPELPPPQRPDAPAEDPRDRPLRGWGASDSPIDRYLAAVMSGDSASADRVATEFARSPEGRQLEGPGDPWFSQHQAAEQAQAQDRQMAR